MIEISSRSAILIFVLSMVFCSGETDVLEQFEPQFSKAGENAVCANEALHRCSRFVHGWLKHADPETGLIPRNLQRDSLLWNAQDAAADNYPFMVLTAALTERELFEGTMRDMLRMETTLTSRLGNLPDAYSFATDSFAEKEIDIHRLIFGGSEYVKDGLLPLTEWLGFSPWSERMLGILDDIWAHAPVETPYGAIPSTSQEVNGEMLQVLSRVYWMTGEEKYLAYAIRLGDYYLFDFFPKGGHTRLRLRDHGCEILSGLTELYVTVHHAKPEKKRQYRESLHKLLDDVLAMGRNEHGLLYNWFDLQTGEHDERLCDTWGYNYNGFYAVYLIDGDQSYREAVVNALSNLFPYYKNYAWENGSADGDADAIESALNLYNREPIRSTADWIESQIEIMWSKQQEDGVIEGWHGDGNFARTSIMYALWKTCGLAVDPWRPDLYFGAVRENDSLLVSLFAEKPWNGKLIFDRPRYRQNLNLPLDYPRINQFPEWFSVLNDEKYEFVSNRSNRRYSKSGADLHNGLFVRLRGKEEFRLLVHQL
jgi:hypothetical protein